MNDHNPVIRDAMGHEFARRLRPQRIVSLVPSWTESLNWMGLEDRVVGVTRFCVRPAHWKNEKRQIGGTKQVDFERLETLEPDFILANKEENTREDVERCAKIAPTFVTDVSTPDEAITTAVDLQEILDPPVRGLANHMRAATDRLLRATQKLEPIPAAYLIWRKPWMVAGGGTFIDAMMRASSFANVFADRKRYPEVSSDELAAATPVAILLSSEPYPFKNDQIAELQSICSDADIRLVDGEAFSWYGSRMIEAAGCLSTLARSLREADS